MEDEIKKKNGKKDFHKKKKPKKGKKICFEEKSHKNNQKIYMKIEKSDKKEEKNSGEDENDDEEAQEEQDEYEEFTIKLSMLYFDQCDPKKCTGKKMEHLGLLKEIKFSKNYGGILLTPTGKKICSIEDHDIIAQKGICVLDCSWAKFNELHLDLHKIETRSLPFMVAVNPVNFGKAYKLTCAEAFAACLFLGGFEKEAKFIMGHFKWGPHFFVQNEELFSKYRGIKSQDELKEIQEKYINEEMERKKKRKESDGLGEFNEEMKKNEDLSNEEDNEEEQEEQIDLNMFKNIKIDENDY
jgi:pre-rRNA-processing protein TSR3